MGDNGEIYNVDTGDQVHGYVGQGQYSDFGDRDTSYDNNSDLLYYLYDDNGNTILDFSVKNDDGMHSATQEGTPLYESMTSSERKEFADGAEKRVESNKNDLLEGESIGSKAMKWLSETWSGLGSPEKAMLLGMGMKGIGGMLTYNDQKKLQKSQMSNNEAQSRFYDAKTAELQAQQANQAGIANMKFGGGLINQPAYQQVTVNRPKVGA